MAWTIKGNTMVSTGDGAGTGAEATPPFKYIKVKNLVVHNQGAGAWSGGTLGVRLLSDGTEIYDVSDMALGAGALFEASFGTGQWIKDLTVEIDGTPEHLITIHFE